MFVFKLQKQKRSFDQVDSDGECEIYAIVKKPRVEERRGKGFKGIDNGRIDPVNAQIRAKCEAETLIIRKDYERERKRIEKQKLRTRRKVQVSLYV